MQPIIDAEVIWTLIVAAVVLTVVLSLLWLVIELTAQWLLAVDIDCPRWGEKAHVAFLPRRGDPWLVLSCNLRNELGRPPCRDECIERERPPIAPERSG